MKTVLIRRYPMPLSEEDIQQLEVLTQLYNTGKLTEDEFDRQTSYVLRGVRRRKRKRSSSLIGRIFGKPAPKVRKRRHQKTAPRRKLVVERRYLEDKLVEQVRSTPSSPPIEPAVFPTRYSHRKRAPSSTTLMSMRNSQRERSTSALSTAATIAVGVLLTLFISRSDPMENLISNLEASNATAIALPVRGPDTSETFIEPLFGPIAVKNCRAVCQERSGSDQATCFKSCERFSINEYGRRITVEGLDPKPDALRIISGCTSKSVPADSFESKDAWLAESRSALKLLSGPSKALGLADFGSTRLVYNNMLDANMNLKMPPNAGPEEAALSRKLIRATCLRAHLTLTELAILMAKENGDNFSRRFFRKLHHTLRPKTEAYERDVLSLAKNNRILDHG